MLLNWEVNLINQIVNCTNNIHGVLGAGAIFFLDIPPAHESVTQLVLAISRLNVRLLINLNSEIKPYSRDKSCRFDILENAASGIVPPKDG